MLPNACPKPPKRAKATRKPLRAVSRSKRVPPPMAGKPTRVRDPEHLERVRAMPCACGDGKLLVGNQCGGWLYHLPVPRSEASHVTNRGWGGGDDAVIPLCPNHHRLLACSWHVAGRVRFQKMFGFDAAKLARQLYDETLTLRGKVTP